MPLNCGAIPEKLVESKLFGHKKGAFTDAYTNQAGVFEDAGEGTVFLDEIGDLPLDAQVKLLRVLEDGTYVRVGDNELKKSKARIVAATNANIEKAVLEGRFRKDLYYRLRGFRIEIKPLRERPKDIKLLANYFLYIDTDSKFRIEKRAMTAMLNHTWDGNVRELRALVKYGAAMASFRNQDKTIKLKDIESNLVPLEGYSSQLSAGHAKLAERPQVFSDNIESPPPTYFEGAERFVQEKPVQTPQLEGFESITLEESADIQKGIMAEEAHIEISDETPIEIISNAGLTLVEITNAILKSAATIFPSKAFAAKAIGTSTQRISKIQSEDIKVYQDHKDAFDSLVQSNYNLKDIKRAIVLNIYIHNDESAANTAHALGVTVPAIYTGYLPHKGNLPELELNFIKPTDKTARKKSIKKAVNKKGKAGRKFLSKREQNKALKSIANPILRGLIVSKLTLQQIDLGVLKAVLDMFPSMSAASDATNLGYAKLSKAKKTECPFYEEHEAQFKALLQSNLNLKDIKTTAVIQTYQALKNKSVAAKRLGISTLLVNRCLNDKDEIEELITVEVTEASNQGGASIDQQDVAPRNHNAIDIQNAFIKVSEKYMGLSLAQIGKGVVLATNLSAAETIDRFDIGQRQAEKLTMNNMQEFEAYRDLFNLLSASNLNMHQIKTKVVHQLYNSLSGTDSFIKKYTTAQRLDVELARVKKYLSYPDPELSIDLTAS